MIGSFLTRVLSLVLGHAYPAYECFKAVELNKPEIEQLRFWCQYWMLVAALTIFEWIGDIFISWLPMYSEAKVAFLVYLWYPRTKGTTYVYETFFKPYVAKHETEIDRTLLELRTRAGDMLVIYSQRVASYGQSRFYEILQYIASQSPSESPRTRTAQQHQQPRRQQPQQSQQLPAPPTAARQPPPVAPQSELIARSPPPPTPAIPTKNPDPESTKAGGLLASLVLPAAVQAQSSSKNTTSLPSSSESASSSTSQVEAEPMQVEVDKAISSSKDDSVPPPTSPQETTIEEVIRVTRGRLRRRGATAGGP